LLSRDYFPAAVLLGFFKAGAVDFHPWPFFDFPLFGFGYVIVADNFTHIV
jgi:hypothetical protein